MDTGSLRISDVDRNLLVASTGMLGMDSLSATPHKHFDDNPTETTKLSLPSDIAREDVDELKTLIKNHMQYTGSTVAAKILESWQDSVGKFIKVMPVDYKKALERIAREKAEGIVLTEV